MNNNVLVTGGSGFIGCQLVKMLIKKKYNVHVLSRQLTQNHKFPPGVIVHLGDITDFSTLVNACKGIHTIYHLAGFAHATQQSNPKINHKHDSINFLGTKNLITAAELADVKQFIFISSSKAVADSPHCVDETWQVYPDTPYGIAKRNAENFLLERNECSNIHITLLRPTLVYGAGCKGNLYNMIKAIDKNYFLPIPNNNNKRSMVSNYDVSRAAILAATNPISNGKIYYVTDGIDYSTYQIYTAMASALGKKIPKWHIPMGILKVLGQLGDLSERLISHELPINSSKMEKLFGSAAFDSTRIQNDLGFKPELNLISMLPEIIASYRNQNDLSCKE